MTSFQQLYETFWPRIYRLCLAYVGEREWARDVCQECFEIAWRQRDQFREEAQMSSWMFRIAVNLCLRQLKRAQKQAGWEAEHHERQQVQGERQVDLELQLFKAINQLPEIDRLLISLQLEQVPQQQIAEMLDLSHANVRVRIHRIKEQLTTLLAPQQID
ncbi:MAG: RNA polymerase sigma factor [Sphingobacteriaceae bacterium]|nr:RNA polymerase sigma factor [Sphingobacteriaceae bacterium]